MYQAKKDNSKNGLLFRISRFGFLVYLVLRKKFLLNLVNSVKRIGKKNISS